MSYFMQQAIFNNIIIVLLTLLGAFTCEQPVFLVICAGVLLVLVTYSSMDDECSWWLTALKLLVMLAFSIISGEFLCFAVFMLLDDVKAVYRGLMSVGVYTFSYVIIYRENFQAVTLVEIFAVMGVAALLYGAKYGIDRYLDKKENDEGRLQAVNISELHTKRLNEQLVMQNYLADKNARLVERENISRNIHNSVGHSITAAIMTLDAADMLYDVRPEDARKKMQDANERIRGSLDSIRRAVRVLDDENWFISGLDLKSEMDIIMDNFMMDTAIKIKSDFAGLNDEVQISREHVEFLTGVLEELLSNGVRHGRADYFMVFLMGDDAHMRLTVSDNGSSDFSEENHDIKIQQGFGLKKIISYVERCGGKAEFTNVTGFHSVIELPLYGGENV